MLNRLLLAAAVIPAIILSANAQQVIEPAPNGVVTLDASRTGMTRIAFEDDRAASVQKIAEGDPEGDFSATKDMATGDLYVVIGENALGNLSFFVTTEGGQTYQVMMGVRDVPTLQVEIAAPQNNDPSLERGENVLAANLSMGSTASIGPVETPVVDLSSVLIQAMYSGARVTGFETRRYRRLDWLEGPLSAQGFSQRGVIEWAGNGATGYAVTVRNEATAPTRINYGRLAVFNVVAATGDQDPVARRQTAQIFLVVKGGQP